MIQMKKMAHVQLRLYKKKLQNKQTVPDEVIHLLLPPITHVPPFSCISERLHTVYVCAHARVSSDNIKFSLGCN